MSEDSSTNSEQTLTFGERAVGLSFNPAGSKEVNQIKKDAATFINTICAEGGENLQNSDGEVIAMRKLALRAAQEAQMWAVKAATWNE